MEQRRCEKPDQSELEKDLPPTHALPPSSLPRQLRDFMLDPHCDPVFAATHAALEQRHRAAAKLNGAARTAGQHDLAAGLQRHHVRQAHHLFVQDHVDIDVRGP